MFLTSNKDKETNKTAEREYAIAVVLNYIDKFAEKKELYIPEYFKTELKISGDVSFVQKLIKQGYLAKDAAKAVALTEKGKSYLTAKSDYVKFFNTASAYVEITEYEAEKQRTEGDKSFESVMIALLLKKIKDFKLQDDFIAVRNSHFDIAGLYEQIGYKPQAMYHYLTALYYETSGLEYYDTFLKYIAKKCTAKTMEQLYGFTCIDPQIITALIRLKDNYTEDMIQRIFEKNPININLCTEEKFKELAESIIGETFVNREWQVYFWEAYKGLIAVARKQTS